MKMTEQNRGMKTPDEILQDYKKSMRDELQLAVFEIPPDFSIEMMRKPENAVYITEDEPVNRLILRAF